jgi:glyoxylate/hydroxypyruvate reductase A
VLNARTFAMMRRDGCVINVARGGHLVARDLIGALDNGWLAHAYLDVFEPEPLPERDPLWNHPGITITPHSAALTEPRTAIPRSSKRRAGAARRDAGESGRLPGRLLGTPDAT